MSISHQKINSLIEEIVEKKSNEFISDVSAQDIEKLCKDVYLIESSISGSPHSKIDDIRNKIILMSEVKLDI